MLVLFGQMAAYYGARATAKRLGKQQVYCQIQANAQLFTKDQKYVKSVFYFKRTPEQTFIRTGREKKDIMSQHDDPEPRVCVGISLNNMVIKSAVSVRRGLGGRQQGPAGHLHRSFLGLVPANKASGVDKDAALDPAELRQRFIPNTTPLFWQRQPGTGAQKGRLVYRWTLWSADHFMLRISFAKTKCTVHYEKQQTLEFRVKKPKTE